MLDLQDCFNIYKRVFSRDFCKGFLPLECGSWLSSDSLLDLKVVIICSTTRDLKVVITGSTTRDLKVVIICSTTHDLKVVIMCSTTRDLKVVIIIM